MRLLLDTHVALWAVTGSRRLPAGAHDLIASGAHEIAVSAVSLWEIAIKHGLPGRRERAPISARQAAEAFEEAGFNLAPVTPAHALAVDDLTDMHGDPFDRLLVAQAIAEPYTFVSFDSRLRPYALDLGRL